MFPQKSDATKARQKKEENKKTSEAIVGNLPADAENYNRYVIVADIAREKANMAVGGDANVESFVAIDEAQKKSLTNPIQTQQIGKNAFLAENTITFL